MPRVIFTEKYDHTWPSRAMTCYPAGWSGSVPRAVATRAIALGKAEKAPDADGDTESLADGDTESLADGDKAQ